jgi:hypothetical protein
MSTLDISQPKKLRRSNIIRSIKNHAKKSIVKAKNSVQQSLSKLLEEPVLEPTHQFSERMNKLKRNKTKKAYSSIAPQRNIINSSKIEQLSENGLSSLTSNATITNSKQEKGLLENISLMENLSEINRAPISRVHKKIAKTKRLNKYYNPNNNA